MLTNQYFIKCIQYSCLSNFLFHLFYFTHKISFLEGANLHFYFFNFLKSLNQQKKIFSFKI